MDKLTLKEMFPTKRAAVECVVWFATFFVVVTVLLPLFALLALKTMFQRHVLRQDVPPFWWGTD